jgi:glutamine synthetase
MFSYQNAETFICEYIWIGGSGEIRSKTRVLKNFIRKTDIIPEWNYDGSSTGQAPSDGNTEVILKPVFYCTNPLRKKYDSGIKHMIVLCETYDNNDNPLPTNHRANAKRIFDMLDEEECWFGLEQEYFICNKRFVCENNGEHYCGKTNYIERQIVEEHLKCCIEAGLNISGINAEVAISQWEFQIGPSKGINAADELTVARYLLERIAEKYLRHINYEPKISDHANGSGCHINFSTKTMREVNGYKEIVACMNKLASKHKEHISVYGEDNHLRLTGFHETSSMEFFTWGIGTRNTSVRIPNMTEKNGCGYFEDRRPAANIDPYLATAIIAETCCCEEEDMKIG